MNPIARRMLQLLSLIMLQAALLFLTAGSLFWLAAWIYLGLYFGCLLVAALIMLPSRREVVEERSRGSAGGKNWDKWLTRLMIIPTVGMLIVAGLDYRFGWPPNLGAAVQVIGGILFLAGYALVVWAMYTNRFFSSIVRIQTERGHIAVTGGPYHFIRHPGYLGMLVSSMGGMLLLDSAWALLTWALYLGFVLERTSLEDRDLRAELPGYTEYADATRYRLVPGVW